MPKIHTYPTLEEVKSATHMWLCRWHRFLRSPETDEETAVNNEIYERFQDGGAMTPQISKALGWD